MINSIKANRANVAFTPGEVAVLLRVLEAALQDPSIPLSETHALDNHSRGALFTAFRKLQDEVPRTIPPTSDRVFGIVHEQQTDR